jgi:MSHA biogenesis protein MshG
MYSLLRTGVPINQSLNGIMRSLNNEYFKEVLGEISHALESGQDLSTSVTKYPRIFSPLFIAMLKVGENTGRLDEAFLQMSQYMEHEKETRNRIKSALRYPSFVLIAISIAITVINIMVVPAFARVFENANTELPIPTQILMLTSDIFVNYWGVLLAIIIISAGSFKHWINSEVGAYHWDKIKLKIPLIGDIINRAILGRFARSFAMTISAGVPLTQALNVVSKAVDNEFIRARVLDIRNAVEQGDSLTRAAIATDMFTPLVIQMLNVGEESGSVDDMMRGRGFLRTGSRLRCKKSQLYHRAVDDHRDRRNGALAGTRHLLTDVGSE